MNQEEKTKGILNEVIDALKSETSNLEQTTEFDNRLKEIRQKRKKVIYKPTEMDLKFEKLKEQIKKELTKEEITKFIKYLKDQEEREDG